ncbi:MAG TPA: hypothetical protein DCZ69_18090, partial [Syntrophobacteraceae bacterium]|nr:hypothetical protein [Syntrophobacteraceae bacterium]
IAGRGELAVGQRTDLTKCCKSRIIAFLQGAMLYAEESTLRDRVFSTAFPSNGSSAKGRKSQAYTSVTFGHHNE